MSATADQRGGERHLAGTAGHPPRPGRPGARLRRRLRRLPAGRRRRARRHRLVDEDYEDVVDVVLLWWRDDDGDLVDALVDALVSLGDGGVVWLLTPKAGRPGHVEPSDIGDAAPTAGLHQTSSISAAGDWSGTRLASRRSGR